MLTNMCVYSCQPVDLLCGQSLQHMIPYSPIAMQTGSSLGFGWVGQGAWHRLSEESGHSRADQGSHRGPGKACYKTLLVTVLAVGTHLLVL